MIPFSVLDLCPILEGGEAGQSLRNSRDLAKHAEQWGYKRYWLAEHHNMPGIASAATSVVISYVAQDTKTILLGAGGVMLPNHAPLVIAEQFGTLAAIYPGRVELGLGRAPGTDPATSHALRRTLQGSVDSFPQDVLELMAFFQPAKQGQLIQAVPGAGLKVPVWILGSSLYGAQLAAMLGLPFAFASHFAPEQMMEAIRIYRDRFSPSETLPKPYVMMGLTVVAADTDEEAGHIFTSAQLSFINLRSGNPIPLPPPVDEVESQMPPAAQELLAKQKARVVVGGPDTVRAGIEAFIAKTEADELMVTSQIYDHAARLRSFEIVAGLRGA